MIGIPLATGLGGTSAMRIMQSQQYTDQLIEEFELAISLGCSPRTIYPQIFDLCGINPSDLTDSDKKRLHRRVEQIYKNHQKD